MTVVQSYSDCQKLADIKGHRLVVVNSRGKPMATLVERYLPTGHSLYAQLLARSVDTEHEQALIRLSLAVSGWLYVAYTQDFADPLLVALLFLVLALSIVVTIVYYPGRCESRRIFGNFVDVAIISYTLYSVESHGIALLAVYLWVILDNGFRYGTGYLWWTTALTVFGFSIATAYSDDWNIASAQWFNALIFLVALPLYCHRFIARLRDLVKQAHRISDAQRLFITSVSHDMRTPLANISSLAELLRYTPTTSEQDDYLRRLTVATTTLRLLIDQVLDTALVEQGHVVIQKRWFDLNTTLERITDIIAPQAHEKNLHFSIETEKFPGGVLGDECRLMQILMNMLGNALQYTHEGGINLKVHATRNSTHSFELVFTIIDSGVGMSSEFLQKFPQPFEREQRCQITPGCGLGASITMQLVKLMGGKMSAMSQEGQGTTIVIRIPFERPEQENFQVADQGLQNMRVLVISQNAHQLCAHLGQWGLVVESVENDLAYYSCSHNATKTEIYGKVIIAAPNALTQGLERLISHLHRHAIPARIILLEHTVPANTAVSDSGVVTRVAAQDILSLRNALLEIRCTQRSPKFTRQHIFVAEDNDTFRLYLHNMLEKAGYTVTVAENGCQAIQMLQQRIEYDAYLLDICMPGKNGLSVFKFLRSQHPGSPKVFALTAAANDDMQQRCEALGFTQILFKPVSMDQIITALRGDPATPPACHSISSNTQDSSTITLDASRLEECRLLGDQFLHNLIESFKEQSESLLVHIEQTDCPGEFREHVHALKNCAASVGAQRMAEMMTTAMETADPNIAQHSMRFRQVSEETYAALRRYLEQR